MIALMQSLALSLTPCLCDNLTMTEQKQSKLIIFVLAALVCTFLGILSANFAQTHFQYEEFNASEIDTQPCPDELTETQCLVYPTYNANASGGFEGYPLVSGQYFCTSDDTCVSVRTYILFAGFSIHTINQIIFSLFYFLLFLSFIWIRSRVRRNADKSSTSVP
jgi:hypothetical protein